MAQRKADKAAERARLAAAAAEAVRTRARDELLSRPATSPPAAAPKRTSAKNFGAKDPSLALAALGCIDLESDTLRFELRNIDHVLHKYCVRSLSEKLTRADELGSTPAFVSVKAASMMAATTVRFLFDVACELREAQPERHAEAKLQWHDCQKMLKNDRSTRGVGIVAYTEAAMALLKDAQTAARAKVQAKVDAKQAYEAAMRAAGDAGGGSP